MLTHLVVAALVLLVSARALAAEHDKPRTVTLPATGLTVEIPGGWVARATPWETQGHLLDMITRVTPAEPQLFLMLDKHPGKTCREWEQGTAARGKQVRGAAYQPQGWHPVANEAATERGANVSFCLEAAGVVYLAAVEYWGSPSDADFQWVTPVLERIAAGATKASGGKTRLRAALLEVQLPPGWVAHYRAGPTGAADLIERVTPASPRLAMMFVRIPEEGDCKNWEDGLRQEGDAANLIDRPAFLPPGWHPVAHRLGADRIGACIVLSSSIFIAMMESDQPLSNEGARAFEPVLASLSARDTRLPGLGLSTPQPPPPTPPVPAPVPAPVAQPPAAAADSYPAAPPPLDDYDDDDDSGGFVDYSRHRLLEGARLDLAVGYLQPDVGEAQVAFVPQLDVEIFAGGRVFGVYADFGLGIGVTSAAPWWRKRGSTPSASIAPRRSPR